MLFLRQSTAGQVITFGQFVSSVDGVTPNTTLTIANTDILLNKNGLNSKAAKNSGGGTHISTGDYFTTLDATDSNTVGRMTLYCLMTGCLQVKEYYHVLAANVYDSLILGGTVDLLDVSVFQVAGVASAATNLSMTAQAAIWGHAVSGTLTTGSCTTDLTLSTTDAGLDGRQIIFLGDVTPTLAKQASNISGWNQSTKLITFSTLTGAPANGDTFIIV